MSLQQQLAGWAADKCQMVYHLLHIQIFISSLPPLGKDPLDGTIAVNSMKKLIPLYKTPQKNTQDNCWSSQLQ